MQTIAQRLDALPDFLAPLKEAASRYLKYPTVIGYFFEGDKRIVSVRGKKKIVGEWTSFSDFLSQELQASEKPEEELHPAKWNG